MFGEGIPSPQNQSRGRLTLWKPLNSCWARWHPETREGSSHHCHGFFRDMSPSLALQAGINPPSAQVGLNLCYLFHTVWSPQNLQACPPLHEDPLDSLIAMMGMWNFPIWSSWFWTSPEAVHPKLPQTAADAPSQWPLFPRMSQLMPLTPSTSELCSPNAELILENKRPKTSHCIRYTELILHSLPSLL